MLFEKQVFTNELITLDGNDFVECTFNGCTFRYNGGEFNISRVSFDSMQVEMEGAAARTVLLLRSLASTPMGKRVVEELLNPSSGSAGAQ